MTVYYYPEKRLANAFVLFEKYTNACIKDKDERSARLALAYLRECMTISCVDVKAQQVNARERRVKAVEIKQAVQDLREMITTERAHTYLLLMETWLTAHLNR